MWRITSGTASACNRQCILVYRLFTSDGLAPQWRATLTFEQAGRDFKKLLI